MLPFKWHGEEDVDDSSYNVVTAFCQSLFNAGALWNKGAQRREFIMVFVWSEIEINYHYNQLSNCLPKSTDV